MSDYDDMDADELSREVAERRGDKQHDACMGGSAHWFHPDDGLNGNNDPQPYASEWWACESLAEELKSTGKRLRIGQTFEGWEAYLFVPGVPVGSREEQAEGDSLMGAVAKLWLRCDDEGLFDDEDEADDEPEYTDEELAEACKSARAAPMHKLQAAADRLRELSGAADKLDEGDGSGSEEVLEEMREWLEEHREFYSPHAPPVGEKAYEVACTTVLDKLDELIGNDT